MTNRLILNLRSFSRTYDPTSSTLISNLSFGRPRFHQDERDSLELNPWGDETDEEIYEEEQGVSHQMASINAIADGVTTPVAVVRPDTLYLPLSR